jgi:hypothetical protein
VGVIPVKEQMKAELIIRLIEEKLESIGLDIE